MNYIVSHSGVLTKSKMIFCVPPFFRVLLLVGAIFLLSACGPPLQSIQIYKGIPDYADTIVSSNVPKRYVVGVLPGASVSDLIEYSGFYICCKAEPAPRTWKVHKDVLLKPLVTVLNNMGHIPYTQRSTYITHLDRMAVDKCIIPHVEESSLINAKEGHYFSVLLKVKVYDVQKLEWIGEVDVWGRSQDKTKQMDMSELQRLAFEQALTNAGTVSDFSKLISDQAL